METKVNYTLVGLFVLILIAALGGVVIWLGKGDYRGAYERYYAYMRESVAGLSVNAAVKYRGVDVGRVKEIALNPENPEEVRLTLDIIRGTPVKEDTIAVLETQGLTGLATVNLTGGSRQSPLLMAKAGEEYPVIKTGPSLFFRLDMTLSRLLAEQQVPRLLTNLLELSQDARTVLSEENRVALKRILTDLGGFTQTLAARTQQVDQTMQQAAQTAENLAKLTTELRAQIPAVLKRVNETAAALQAITEDLARTSKTVRGVVSDAKPNVEQFTRQTLPETHVLVGELRQLTASLQRVSRQLERDPSSLVFGHSPAKKGPGE